jgi:uncharacterized protein (TIRG00374 family)
LLVGTVGFFYLVGSKRRISSFFQTTTRLLNKLIHIFRTKSPETFNVEKAQSVVEDFHDNYLELKKSWGELKAPFLYALLANITEVLAVYVVFIAFGHVVNIGAVILAYAIANFAGLISVLPGGVGIYEALMTTVLAATGIPASVSLPAIIMYRLLNTIIQLPPGYYFYLQTLRTERRGELPGAE